MREQVIHYWDKVLQEDYMEPSANDYVVRFSEVNMVCDARASNWSFCNTFQKLIGYVQYIALPSIQISRAMAEDSDISCEHIYFDTSDVIETVNTLHFFNSRKEILDEYERWYNRLADLDENSDFEELKTIVKEINDEIGLGDAIFIELEVFRNIKEVGEDLITSYDEDGFLDQLEDLMNFNVEQIRHIFNNFDENPFLKKRIVHMLYNTIPY